MNHTPNVPASGDPQQDLLLQRYAEANALDEQRPGPALRETVLAHAKAQAAAHLKTRQSHLAATAPQAAKTAANDGAWKLRALGSLAVLGLVGLLALQFDRGHPDERELALGRPSVSSAQGPATAPETPQPVEPAEPPAREPVAVAPSASGESLALPTPSSPKRQAIPPAAEDRPTARGTPPQLKAASPPLASPAPLPAATAGMSRRAESGPTANEATAARPAVASSPMPASSAASPAASAKSFGAAQATPESRSGLTAQGRLRATPGSTLAAPAAADAQVQAEPAGVERLDDAPAAAPDQALLAAAASRDSLQAVREALAKGARVDASLPDGRTALMLAAQRGDGAMVRLLIDQGADVQRLDHNGLSAADWAGLAGQASVLPLLLQPPDR